MPAPAPAQIPTPSQDSVRPVIVNGNFGFVDARGNTRITTLSASELVEYRPRRSALVVSQLFQWVFGRTNGETTASLITLGGRVGYTVASRLQLFAAITFDRNRFAGIARRFEEQAGLSIQAIARPRSELSVDLGGTVTQQRTTVPASETFVALRAAGRYLRRFEGSAYFQQTVEILPNVDDVADVRVNAESAVVAPLSRRLAIRVSYVIRFDNRPPEGFQRADRVLTTGLQVTL